MAYPDEIILSLSTRYNLQTLQQPLLREILLEHDIRTAIEAGRFIPDDIILLLEIPNGPNLKILSLPEVKQLLAHPELLSDRAVWLEWNRIKYYIEQLNQLRKSAIKERKILAIEILQKIDHPVMRTYIAANTALFKTYMDISAELHQHANARYEPIDIAAEEYFRNYYTKQGKTITEISFGPKRGGVQLGRVMKVQYQDSQGALHNIQYFIKTHQQGSLSDSRSRSAVHIDLKELLVYKILEYTGYGPKAHFFSMFYL